MRRLIPICLFAIYCIVGILVLIGQVVVEPIALKNIIAQLECNGGGCARRITAFIIVFVLCAVLQNLGKALTSIIQQLITAWQIRTWSNILYQKLMSAVEMSSEPEMLVKRVMRDVETVASFKTRVLMELPIQSLGLVATIATMLCGTLSTFGFDGLAMQKGNVPLTLVVIALLPLQFIFMLFNQRTMAFEQKQADAQEKECFIATEALRGISDVRLNNGFHFISDRIRDCLSVAFKARFCYGAFVAGVRCVTNTTWALSQSAILAASAWLIYVDVFSFSDYVAFSAVAGVFNLFAMGIIELGIENQKTAQPRLRLKAMAIIKSVDDEGKPFPVLCRSLSLDNVSSGDILHEISVNIRKGEHVVITGPSGCGKTTLLNVIVRQRKCSSGHVWFNDVDVENLSAVCFVDKIAFVPQRPFLFDASVRENILMGLRNVDEETLISVVKAVGLEEYLSGLDQDISVALGRVVSAGAMNISGGQIARIALARALIRNPDILLLDETTAALDDQSECQICTMLHKRMSGRTIISVSHRKRFIETFPRIMVMREGRIMEDKINGNLMVNGGAIS